jgi:hypothetical protein
LVNKILATVQARRYVASVVKITVTTTEAKFLDVVVTKVLKDFLLAIHSHLYYGFYTPPPPRSKNGLKLVCNANIVCGNLKSENSLGYAQKPQRNCTFMNSASGLTQLKKEFYRFIYIGGITM